MPKLITTHTRIADLGKPRVIIIGGGFGGLELAKALHNERVQVVLFDRHNHHTFQPLLYQVATSGLETNSIVFPFRKRFATYQDFYFRMGEVTAIKPEENYIETSIGGIRYDYLVIATGATTNFYGMDEVEQNSMSMKTITDAIKVRNRVLRNLEIALLTDDAEVMNSLMDYVIVGGGPTGVELAGALSELKRNVFPKDYKELDMSHMDIHLVEAGPRLLNGMSANASAKAQEYLEGMGVKVHLNCAVKSYDGYEVIFNTGERLISRSLIWAAGIKGNPIAGLKPEVIARGNRIKVDEFNRVQGYENIFAVGDVALMEGDPKFPTGHPQIAPPAMQQGKLLAKNILKLVKKKPMKPFRYKHAGSMATVGRNKAVVNLKAFSSYGVFAWYIWMFVHLMSIVGFKNKVFTFFSWVWNYFSYDRSNRLIIGRPKEDMISHHPKG
ncbi:MAG: NAD(P)/FAD-dependent oxidoreductase [Cyclobacteriaceae bacterium]|nr:NAD(P)/FAD-dependent oxidoreductase [Cyclobacteriaceae bacterium]